MNRNIDITLRNMCQSLMPYVFFVSWLFLVVVLPRGALAGENTLYTAQAHTTHNIVRADDLLPLFEDVLIKAGAPDTAEITLAQPERALPEDSLTLTAEDISHVVYSESSGRFLIRLNLASLARPVTISGHARKPVIVPVLVSPIARGERIEADNLDWVSKSDLRTKAYISSEEDLIGMVAKRPLRANAPLRRHDVQKPVLINRGALITMTYEQAGLRLTHRAIAEESGGKGDLITVRNPKTERSVKAIVSGKNRVSVLAAASFSSHIYKN